MSPPDFPCLASRKKAEFPLFGKEGLGKIFTTIYLFNYVLLSSFLRHPASIDLVRNLSINIEFVNQTTLLVKELFSIWGLTKDLQFDMSGVGNPKKKGEAMSEKVVIYGKAG
jgi:hypothetical protein